MTQLLERDVVSALAEVKSVCSEQVYELLEAVLTSQAHLIERLQRDNITIQEKVGVTYFNILTCGQSDLPGQIRYMQGNA